ncbi:MULTISPECIES: hypothetical protein [Microbacterium]|uniref:hypothetical protein n=1 Tax=Microbacterium TaxID=33882 RepID=UPI00278862CB|nr:MULTISPECIES: hypothetical protein [Microbacterium]MDQ1084184.1 hypothetical protein [Microbacterium sp. SORGH_AS_0344]MDQ1170541.1 hypothetical protein [Microbacterium proteolyticum]
MTDQDRDDVAAATGVPATLLRGDTRAELEHHASQLKDAGYGADLTATQIVDIATGRADRDPNIEAHITQALGR